MSGAANALRPGYIDFDTCIPEKLRGLPPYNGKVNWDALELVCRVAEGSPLQRRRIRDQLFKSVKKHGPGCMTPKFRLSYVTARLSLGDFSDYWGWEFRGAYDEADSRVWAAEMYWAQTWMPKWGGGNVKRLLVLGEQGIGDAVFFASILPECLTRCGEVIYECDNRLHTLLERSLRGLKCESEREFEDRRRNYGLIDAFIPAGELMRMFRRDKSHFPAKPYLKADPKRLDEMEVYRGRTGIAWRGRQGSFDPQKTGIENPISVQYGEQHPDIETPHINLKDDIEGLVALCSVLSRVVTAPQSVHHFAGALGKPVQIIRPEKEGEVENQLRWDHPVGKLPWYADAIVYRDIEHWRQACQ